MLEDINVYQIDIFTTSQELVEQDDSEESSNDTLDDLSSHPLLDQDMARIHSRLNAYIKVGGTFPIVHIGDLLGCTFISKPGEEGEQMRAKMSIIEPTDDTTANYMEHLYKV
jgi:hypothetical protein